MSISTVWDVVVVYFTLDLNYFFEICMFTWQEGPLYPWGQEHSSTSRARSLPVGWGTAMSILMSEILINTKKTHNDQHTLYLTFSEMLLDASNGIWMRRAVTIPALSHFVRVAGSDHEDGNVSQSHQQVLASARLPVGATPRRLRARGRRRTANIKSSPDLTDRMRLPCEQWNTPLWRSQWRFVGLVGEAWSESSVPGRCRCPGGPHLAYRRQHLTAEAVQSAPCIADLHHRPSPGSKKEERVNSGKVFHPIWYCGGSHKTPMLTVSSKEAPCVDKCSLFTWQHAEAWLSGTERAERSSSTNTSACIFPLLPFSLLYTLFFSLSPYLPWSPQAGPSSRRRWGHWWRSGTQLQTSPSGRCLQR